MRALILLAPFIIAGLLTWTIGLAIVGFVFGIGALLGSIAGAVAAGSA